MKSLKPAIVLVLLTILNVSPLFSQDHFDLLFNGERDFEVIRESFYSWWEKTGKKTSDYKKFKRWENFILPRLENGQVPVSSNWSQRISYYKVLRKQKTDRQTDSQVTWEPMGPYEWGVTTNGYSPGNGRVNCITVDPKDENHIFIGSAGGGLWESADGGESWSTTTDNLAVLGITDIYIDPDNSDEIIILTGDAYGNDTPSVGLFKSTDGGDTWSEMPFQFEANQYQVFYKLEVSTTNKKHMIIGGNGVYLSTDGGQSWNLTLDEDVTDVVMHPTDNQIVYSVIRNENEADKLTTFKSINGGATWITNVFDVEPGQFLGRKAIGVSADSPDSVYILASTGNSTFGGLYLSTDQLNTLQTQSLSPNIFGYEKDGGDNIGQGWYDLSIAVSPDNVNEIYVSGIHIWKSMDAGVTWELQNYWVYSDEEYPYVHADNHTLDFANDKLYAGGDGGVFMSPDHGDTFQNLSFGLNIGQFYRIGTHPTDEGIVIGGLQDNGSFFRYNEQWKQVFGADGMDALIDHTDPATVYSSYQNGGLIRYLNNAESIVHFIENQEESGGWITPYIMHPEHNNVLYIGYQNVWKSEDQGNTMERISDFQTTDRIRFLKQNQEIPTQLLTSITGKLYVTSNEGADWTDVTAGLPGYYLTDAEFSYDTPGTIYASFSHYLNGEKLYVSTDLGSTWTDISAGIPAIPVNCIESQSSCDNEVFIGTDVGVFFINDNMDQWQPYGAGLPNVVVNELEVQYATGKIFAATYGRGVWKTDITLASAGELPQTVSFESINSKAFGDEPFELLATSSAGLTMRYKSSDTEILSISGNLATILKPGTVSISANQKGNCEYLEASAIQEITIDKGEQEITFNPIENKTSNMGVISLVARATSDLPVSFSSSDESIFSVNGSRGEILKSGVVTITAEQAGDDFFNAAEPVTQMFAIITLGEEQNESLSIYPNPVKEKTTISFSDKGKRSASLYNLNGQLIRSFSLTRKLSQELDLTGLKSGVYVLRIDDITIELIKE